MSEIDKLRMLSCELLKQNEELKERLIKIEQVKPLRAIFKENAWADLRLNQIHDMENDTQKPDSPRQPKGGEEPLDPAYC